MDVDNPWSSSRRSMEPEETGGTKRARIDASTDDVDYNRQLKFDNVDHRRLARVLIAENVKLREIANKNDENEETIKSIVHELQDKNNEKERQINFLNEEIESRRTTEEEIRAEQGKLAQTLQEAMNACTLMQTQMIEMRNQFEQNLSQIRKELGGKTAELEESKGVNQSLKEQLDNTMHQIRQLEQQSSSKPDQPVAPSGQTSPQSVPSAGAPNTVSSAGEPPPQPTASNAEGQTTQPAPPTGAPNAGQASSNTAGHGPPVTTSNAPSVAPSNAPSTAPAYQMTPQKARIYKSKLKNFVFQPEDIASKLPPYKVPPSIDNQSSVEHQNDAESEPSDVKRPEVQALKILAKSMGLAINIPPERPRIKSNRSVKRDYMKHIKDGLEDEDRRNIDRLVLFVFKKALEVSTMSDFVLYTPANKDEVEKYETDNIGEPKQFYFGDDWRTCKWNNRMLVQLVGFYRTTKAAPLWANTPNMDELYIYNLFERKLGEAREQYRLGTPRMVGSKQETQEEVMARVKNTLEKTQASTSRRSNKSRLYERRKKAMTDLIQMAQTDARFKNHLLVFRYLGDINQRLGVNGQSSDESDTDIIGGTAYRRNLVKECPWRAKEIGNYLQVIDKLRETFLASGTASKPTVPRVRNMAKSESNDNTPLCGLPAVMYNEAWLKRKETETPEYAKLLLNISDEELELMTINSAAWMGSSG